MNRKEGERRKELILYKLLASLIFFIILISLAISKDSENFYIWSGFAGFLVILSGFHYFIEKKY